MHSNTTHGLLITRLEAAHILRITLPTLHSWTKKGYLKSYRIGIRTVYYKLDEKQRGYFQVDEWDDEIFYSNKPNARFSNSKNRAAWNNNKNRIPRRKQSTIKRNQDLLARGLS
ncbi:MAG: helix-turn-helix domain-containing protein, partial [Bacteroidales bacterium]|nr:helix-turn-helix domain-containing protein [Bacteroidales bacterium]